MYRRIAAAGAFRLDKGIAHLITDRLCQGISLRLSRHRTVSYDFLTFNVKGSLGSLSPGALLAHLRCVLRSSSPPNNLLLGLRIPGPDIYLGNLLGGGQTGLKFQQVLAPLQHRHLGLRLRRFTKVERVVFNVQAIANALCSILEKFHIGLIILTDIFMNLTGTVHLQLQTAFAGYLFGDIAVSLLDIGFGLLASVKAV